jgi:hypothetical protein
MSEVREKSSQILERFDVVDRWRNRVPFKIHCISTDGTGMFSNVGKPEVLQHLEKEVMPIKVTVNEDVFQPVECREAERCFEK